MAPVRGISGVNRKIGKGGPSVSINGRSPLRAKKSPFKARRSSLAKTELSGEANSEGAGISANIRVAVRVRPENERELTGAYRNVIQVVDDRMLIFDPENNNDDFFYHGKKVGRRDLNKRQAKDQKFAFDAVFGPNSTNEDVFENTTKDLIDVIFNGYNCSVFVYGATGAGKTHTMLGSTNNPGITFRTVMELYKKIEDLKEERTVEIAVSYLEVYNESIIDLINPESGQLAIRDDGKSANIAGLSVHRPNGPEDLLRILQYGNSNRRQHPTDANKESSRSHAVFQVLIKQKNRCSGLSSDVKVAKLSMIDLAGSEKGSVTGSKGARFREGANINKSLLALGNCINALAEGSKYIPYRNSKLTRLLKDSIGGNCRTVMISNVSPSSMTFEDTFNTLRYADRAKKIKINLKKNVLSVNFHVGQYAKIVEDLKSEVTQLKQKIITLELENEALKAQADMAPENEIKEDQKRNETVDELEKLRVELNSLIERQSDYDNLQKRLDEFEQERKEIEKPIVKCNCSNTTDQNNRISTSHDSGILASNIDNQEYREGSNDEKNEEAAAIFQKEHQDKLLKFFNETSKLKLMKARRATHEKRFKRYDAISLLDNASAEAQMSKLHKFVVAQGHKIDKSTKKCRRLLSEQDQSEFKILETLGNKHYQKQVIQEFKQQCHELKSECSNNHLANLLRLLIREQTQSEEILIESLKQLKKSHLLLRSQGQLSDETKQDFDSLVTKIQCNRLQFRDSHLVETNHDELEDFVGTLYSNSSNLDLDMNNPDELLIEGLDDLPAIEKSNDRNDFSMPVELSNNPLNLDTIISITSEEQQSCEVFDESNTTEIWRPPTPPKVSPKTKEMRVDNSHTENPKTDEKQENLTDRSPSKTPSPPQLSSIDISSLDTQRMTERYLSSPCATTNTTEYSQLDLRTNLNETFDLPSVISDTNLDEECDKNKNESIQQNNCSEPNLEGSYSLDPIEISKHSISNNIREPSVSENFYPMDTTITMDQENNADSDIGQISSNVDINIDSNSKMEDISLPEINCSQLEHVKENPKENNEDETSGISSTNGLIVDFHSAKIIDKSNDSAIFHPETKRKASERRGTFTITHNDSNTSPIVAVVPPNTRRDINLDIQDSKALDNNREIPNRNLLHITSTENSIDKESSITESSPNFSKKEIKEEVQSTPAKVNAPPTASSVSGGKRTLKRAGMNSTVGTSASTSKLLKGLSAYRPLNKGKVPNNGNQMPKIQQTQTLNAPSYMAATASSSRKLNFATAHIDSSNNKGNTHLQQITLNSPNSNGIQGDTSAKENQESRVFTLSRSKDISGSMKKLKKGGASMSALRQYNR